MRALLPFCLPALLAACSTAPVPTGDTPTPPADSNYIAEVRITSVDTTARLCGSGRRYQLAGPDMDTLLLRYNHANVRKGQWMKVWFAAHPGTVLRQGLPDSALILTKFHHLDASLSCDPIPDQHLVGTYGTRVTMPGAMRSSWLDLHADGTAVLRTELPNTPMLEEEGTWGIDVEGRVAVKWPQRDQTMLYRLQDEVLLTEQSVNGQRIGLNRLGRLDRQAGSFGRAVRWLAAVGGSAVDTAAIRPGTTLEQVLPEAERRTAFLRSVPDTLGVDSATAGLRMSGVSDVRGLMRMLRAYGRKR